MELLKNFNFDIKIKEMEKLKIKYIQYILLIAVLIMLSFEITDRLFIKKGIGGIALLIKSLGIFSVFYFIKKSKLERAVNLFLFFMCFSLVMSFKNHVVANHLFLFFLSILAIITIYVKAYQIIFSVVIFSGITIVKLLAFFKSMEYSILNAANLGVIINLYILLFITVFAIITTTSYYVEVGKLLKKSLNNNKRLNIEVNKLKILNNNLETLASIDDLTGALNRRRFDKIILKEMETSEKNRLPFTLMIFDVDYFKNINDDYGHKEGDLVLLEISTLIKNSLKDKDYFIRWGGDEFILILSENDLNKVKEFAKMIGDGISRLQIIKNKKITISIGITQYKNGDNIDSILKRADLALYKSKDNGRNQISVN